jgi:hypothetical protein
MYSFFFLAFSTCNCRYPEIDVTLLNPEIKFQPNSRQPVAFKNEAFDGQILLLCQDKVNDVSGR